MNDIIGLSSSKIYSRDGCASGSVVKPKRRFGMKSIPPTDRSFGVYRITIQSERGEMYYIGSTMLTFRTRRNQHINDLKKNKHANPYLQRLWDKYQEFRFEILEVCSDKTVTTLREQWHIEHTDTQRLINCGPAYPSPRYGVAVSSETRKKQSASAKKRFENPEERAHMKLIRMAQKFTEETRAKISASSKRIYNTSEGRAFLSRINKGKVVSDETREKLRAANQGKQPSASCIQAVRLANTGRKQSEELKRRKSDAMKKLYIEHPEMIEEISRHLSERVITDETRKKLSIVNTGKTHTKETKEKLRQAALAQHAKKKGRGE